MTKRTIIQLRISEELKKKIQTYANKNNTTISNLTRAYYEKIIRK